MIGTQKLIQIMKKISWKEYLNNKKSIPQQVTAISSQKQFQSQNLKNPLLIYTT